MASSLFQHSNQIAGLLQLKSTIDAVRSGNAEKMAMQMMQSNPNFRAFAEKYNGKSPESILKDCGVDIGSVKSILSMLK